MAGKLWFIQLEKGECRMSIFHTEVTAIGPEAALFKEEKMLILFGENAPEGLAEYCYNIVLSQTTQEIAEGMTLHFDARSYKITAVGKIVNKNLNELGHITIKFDGSKKANLSGTLYVEESHLPEIQIGTRISITE